MATEAHAAPAPPRLFWAPRAWIGAGWHSDVTLRVGGDGTWAAVHAGSAPPADAARLDGPVLPGLVDAHGHSFQRAFAGLAEQRAGGQDDFWSWRECMYATALRLSPEAAQAIAAQLFVELARGGFTEVCEFHYLHNGADGRPYADDPARMARAVALGAAEAGIGLTLLPAVYERAGFGEPHLRAEQRRFRAGVPEVLHIRDTLRALAQERGAGLLRAGLALHSLRAVGLASIERLVREADDAPIHVHVAEQTREVDECLAANGQRPVEWLCRHVALDRRWQLVHATHVQSREIDLVAHSGAGVVLCPSTEANLGDGITDLPGWLRSGVPLTLGTDSHVTRSAPEELRLLEYGQRLVRRVRCVGAEPERGEPSTAHALWRRMADGGAAAAGFERWGLQRGARADLLVVDTRAAALQGVPDSRLLDALVFSSPSRPFRDVMVAGRWIVRDHRCEAAARIAARFADAMKESLGAE